MCPQRKIPTDSYNVRFIESYDSGMREKIGGWRDKGYGFDRISRLLLEEGFNVSGYIIEKETKNYDTRFLEETEFMKDMVFLKERGIIDEEIYRRLHEEGIKVEASSIAHSFSKWESDEVLGNEQMMKEITEQYLKGGYAHDIVEHYRDNGIDLKESAVKSALSRSGVWRKKKSMAKFYKTDNSIDFPGNTGGSMPARPVRNRGGY